MKCLIGLAFLVCIFLPSNTLGDDPRINNHFTSANKQFELRLTDDWTWNLVEKSSGHVLYQIDGSFSPRAKLWAMSAFISDDGRYVIAVDHYSEQDFATNPEVLYFFKDGQRLRSYKLNDLFETTFVEASVSHFRWLLHPRAIALIDRQVNLITYELNKFTFNIETGDLVKKEKDDLLSNGSEYIFGTVRSISKFEFEIKIRCSIYGPAKPGAKLRFTSTKYGWDGSGFDESLVLRRGELVEKMGIFFNNCEDPVK